MIWTGALADETQNPRARPAAELLSGAFYATTAEGVRAFIHVGGGCRATYSTIAGCSAEFGHSATLGSVNLPFLPFRRKRMVD